ncbi:hypothetical protein LTR56_014813 [Elasticomyces elasticus]|nr:hypothetical protein LTR56_014813 [Elasticomyces elasticus]KAK3644727.1 hypothetical protein LTR22_015102 [Elasticomyces elasticus]KAK4916112.1 hypothetical protein LTR49_015886 [Elasticomyces elasticus]KAK5755148.1 hypothetical protein LTS12_014712 [Elasticomyces elasticus]
MISQFWSDTALQKFLPTAAAHDDQGYFKTGDICRKEGEYFFIIGRASLNIIKSGGYKIGAVEIERCLLELPYCQEAMVLGVEDEAFGQRVAAAVTLPGDNDRLSLGNLRADLRNLLPGYKLPTALRVVAGELPKGATGNVQKKIMAAILSSWAVAIGGCSASLRSSDAGCTLKAVCWKRFAQW